MTRSFMRALMPRSWWDCYALAIPIIFVVATIGPELIGLRTLLSVNLLTGYMPWQASQGWDAPGHQYCSTDTIDAVMPGIEYTRHMIFSGHLANWQGLVGGGGPLGSTPDLALLNPLALPYLVLPLWLAPAFVKLFEFVAAIGGTYLFLRRLGRTRLASSVAGVIFASSGFMVMWTNWPQTRVAALVPALFWAVERLVQRSRLSDAGLIALVVASMLLGGFPAVTGFALYLAVPYLVVRLIARHGRALRPMLRPIGLGALGLVLGTALSAVQMLPFLVRLSETDLGYRAQTNSVRLPFSGLLTLVDPSSNGLCINAQIYGKFNPVELIAFVGSTALVLVVVALSTILVARGEPVARGTRTFLLGAVVLMIVLGWIGGTVLGLFQHLPLFSNNFVGRIRSVFGFVLAVLAAFGLDALAGRLGGTDRGEGASASERPERPGLARLRPALGRLWFVGVWAVVAFGAIVVLLKAHREGVDGQYWGKTRATLLIPALLVLAAIVAAILTRSTARWLRTAALAAIPLLIIGQSVAFFRGVLPGDDPDDFYPVTGTHQFLADHLGHDRFDSSRNTIFPATSLYYGLRVATGHFFLTPEWADLLKAVDPKSRQSQTNYIFSGNVTPATVGDSPILDRMGVKYFVFDPDGVEGQPMRAPSVDGSTTVQAGAAGTCALPAGPLRAVSFTVSAPLAALAGHNLIADITVRAGNTVVSSGRYLAGHVAAGTTVQVAVAGETLPSSAATSVEIRFQGAAGTASFATSGGQIACSGVRPISDGLRLVYADAGSVVYQRLTALPRIRWASSADVVTDPTAQVAALRAGVPADQVVLDAPGPVVAAGKPAAVSVDNDSGDRITATLNTQGAGYLVVADAMQVKGWTASVDGASAPLVAADHAMVAVPVGAGQHTIQLNYNAPRQKLGLAVSIVGAVAVIAVFVADAFLRRRRRTQQAARPEPASPPEHDGSSRPTLTSSLRES